MIHGIAAIRRLYEAATEGKHPDAVFLIIDPGGALRAGFSAGIILYLDLYNLISRINIAVGVSAGLSNLSYCLARQAMQGVTIYPNLTSGFLKLALRPRFLEMDLSRLRWFFEKSAVSLNQERLINLNDQYLLGALTCKRTGKLLLVPPFNTTDPLSVLCASAALPYITKPITTDLPKVGKLECVDGGMFGTLAFRKAVRLLEHITPPTDYIILQNKPLGAAVKAPWREWFSSLGLLAYSTGLAAGALTSSRRDREALRSLVRMSDANVSIIAPDTDLGGLFTKDSNAVRQRIEQGFTEIPKLLGLQHQFPDINWDAPFAHGMVD